MTPSDELTVDPLVSLSLTDRNAALPPQPKTEILDSAATNSASAADEHDSILDPPPLPTGITTLVGGTVRSIDRVQNRLTIAVFSGNRWKINFDERTHIFMNGAETTPAAIKKGERVYVDTMLDDRKHEVFARNIRLGMPLPAADADGQVISLDPARGVIVLRDQMNSAPVRFNVNNNTRISYGNSLASLRDLKEGSLVHVTFSPGESTRGLAREINILAAPGSAFTYVGKITYLDVHRGMMAIKDSLDQKSYEVRFDPLRMGGRNDITIGSEVRIVAIFDGNRYSAQSITLTKSAEAADKEK